MKSCDAYAIVIDRNDKFTGTQDEFERAVVKLVELIECSELVDVTFEEMGINVMFIDSYVEERDEC